MAESEELGFIKQRCKTVIKDALDTKDAAQTCPSHGATVEVGVTGLQVGTMSLDMQSKTHDLLEQLIHEKSQNSKREPLLSNKQKGAITAAVIAVLTALAGAIAKVCSDG